jgi:hypothetical protein
VEKANARMNANSVVTQKSQLIQSRSLSAQVQAAEVLSVVHQAAHPAEAGEEEDRVVAEQAAAGDWRLDAGCWILDAGYWMLEIDTGFWIVDSGYHDPEFPLTLKFRIFPSGVSAFESSLE